MSRKSTFQRNLLYSLPYAGVVFLYTPMAILQGVYAKYYGFSLAALGAVVLIARIFDAITDPLVGILSDICKRRINSRKPLIVVGALLYVMAGYFLYSPSAVPSTIYFLCWLLLFYLGWTIFEISHAAWGGDLAREPADKTKIYSMRVGAGNIGLSVFYIIPLLPLFQTSDITPETLHWCAIVGVLLILPCLTICILRVPSGHELSPSLKDIRW